MALGTREVLMGRMAIRIMFLAGLFFLIYGCSDQGEEVITGTGTIVFSSLEGGCWSVDLDDGTSYELNDFPLAFREDGLRVRIAAKLSNRHVSYCQFGIPIIDIVSIYRL
jgi:hypothetical protein